MLNSEVNNNIINYPYHCYFFGLTSILKITKLFIILLIILIIKRDLFNLTKNNKKEVINNNEINNKEINKTKLRVGVICCTHHKNVGNNLLKYAMSIKLNELGVEPYMIGIYDNKTNLNFLQKTVKMIGVRNFSQIKKNDYDILMVNSDQTWHKWDSNFYDIAFLKFAENWNIKKFIYGASISLDYWSFSKEAEEIAKRTLKYFKGISLREIGSIQLVRKHLGIKAEYVLDPTLLIDKKYYLNIINKYKNNNLKNTPYILTYKLNKIKSMELYIKKVKKKYNYTIYNIDLKDADYIEKFLSGIYHSKAVITNSYHAVIFSIIFNKPFVVFMTAYRGNERFHTISKITNIKDRFFDSRNNNVNVDLLNDTLKINRTLIDYYRNKSINYLKNMLLSF